MKTKNMIALSSFLLLMLLLSIGTAAADENATMESMKLNAEDNSVNQIIDDAEDNTVNTSPDNGQYNAKIIAENVTQEYGDYNDITIRVVDNDNNPIEMADPYIKGTMDDAFLYFTEYQFKGEYYFYHNIDAGTHIAEVGLDDGIYKAEPVFININILKTAFTGDIDCKSYWGTDKTTLTMKATVYNTDDEYYEDGYVTFKVNGKSYKVQTENGVAIKKIKIKKAGTYTYTATFTNNNYNSSMTGKGKLYVYSTSKKARTFSIKGYKIVVPLSKYKKLVNAKNTNKLVCFEIKTSKYFKQRVGSQKTVYKWKYMGKVSPETAHEKGWKVKNYVKHWISDGEYYYTCDAYKKVASAKIVYKTVKGKVSMIITYGGKNGGQFGAANKYSIHLNTPYQNPGYDYCTPWLYGAKKSTSISKLNKAKTTKW